MPIRKLLAAAALPMALAISSAAISAELKPRPLDGPALFADYGDDAGENISGVVCRSGGHCVVVSDEMISLQRIQLNSELSTYRTGKTFENSFSECFDPSSEECPEWDLEALARDGDRLFATGSMGFKRKKVRFDPNRWVVVELAIGEDGRPRDSQARTQANLRRLGRLFQGHTPNIVAFVDKPLQCGGLNIEGLAHHAGRLYFGLRSPSEREAGRAHIVSADAGQIFADSGPLAAKLHTVAFKNANGQAIPHIGIRALESIDDDLLIVTGPAGVGGAKRGGKRRAAKLCRALPGGGYDNLPADEAVPSRLWLWRPGGAARAIGVIAGKYDGQKLEGIAVIARRGKRADLLLAFDDPDDVPPLAVLKDVALPD